MKEGVVLGVDLAPPLDGTRRPRSVNFAKADVLALPLRAASVDLCTAFEIIEHFEEPQPFLKEVARVLKPGGMLVLSTPNAKSITAVTGRALYPLVGRAWNAWDPTHKHLFTPAELLERLRSIGFDLVRVEGSWFFPEGIGSLFIRLAGHSKGLNRFCAMATPSSLGVDLGFVTYVVARLRPPNAPDRTAEVVMV